MNKVIIDKQKELNMEVASMLKNSDSSITNLRLISLGNSIASGYSMVRTIKPLLLRNDSIESIMKEYDIELERYHFARAQNNNDEHIFEWLASNVTENEMHEMNRRDYSLAASSMVTHELTPEQIEKYYPYNETDNKGLRDLALDNNLNTANIIIYNGCTGSFLDAATRNGKLTQQLMSGVNRDTVGLESVLKYIQTNNRTNQANTQVYVCGAPNFLGLGISELINKKLRKIVKNYANVSYVEPVKSKFFYRPLEEATEEFELGFLQNFLKNHMYQVDIHYDEEEYLNFNNNIMEKIKENYEINNSMISIDRQMYELNHSLEVKYPELIGDEAVPDMIDAIVLEETKKFSSQEKKDKLLKRANSYLINRSPYDYFYVGKKNIKESFQNGK